MTQANKSSLAFQTLIYLITKSTLLRINKHCRSTEFKLNPAVDSELKTSHDHMSLILLWSSLGTIVLKTHFEKSVAKQLAAEGLCCPTNDLSDELALDFMREFSNLQAGFLRGVFEACGIRIGMSLPFLVSGKDEAIFTKVRNTEAEVMSFQLINPQLDITILCGLESIISNSNLILSNKSSLERIIQDEENLCNQSTEGEINFL